MPRHGRCRRGLLGRVIGRCGGQWLDLFWQGRSSCGSRSPGQARRFHGIDLGRLSRPRT
ncbi:hypothetical protein CU044_7005 [Streptomyces sp. L-9-10]|nr:hypothetical protein CU044_7005 [Streptomyces sp. L-9-10]